MRRTLVPLLIVILVGILFYVVAFSDRLPVRESPQPQPTPPENLITNFEECVAAGNPVLESYPARCTAGDQTFVQDIGNEMEKSDLIKIDEPRPTALVTSPLVVRGEARGTWYFEDDFPVHLYDHEQNVIAVGIAQAEGNWMTEDFVPFSTTLEFSTEGLGAGTLVLRRSNPSGLPENDDELIVPVRFR